MTEPVQPLPQLQEGDRGLDDLLAEFANNLQAGECADLEAFVREHADHEEELRRLLPAMQVLADLGDSTGTAEPALALRGPDPLTGLGELGDYRLLRELGRGGMGVVYEAEQMSLGRRVALKVLPFAAALDPKQLQRFKNEAQAAAQLQHQNIVPVHGVGCERGVHYYAMQFIEGHTLAALIDELRQQTGLGTSEQPGASGPAPPARGLATGNGESRLEHPEGAVTAAQVLPRLEAPAAATTPRFTTSLPTGGSTRSPAFFRSVANLGVQAAEALEHAHQMGVVHRDIKPANLLVDGRGNLWVTDFGLAQFQNLPGLTTTGDLVGTLRYMSPEQARARSGPVDHRTDVYSLGATFYELLTLHPPIPGHERQELLAGLGRLDPVSPRRLNPALPADLETILLKALAKEPLERYDTAREMADDLRRFLEDKPIRARRPTVAQRAVKWARRTGGWSPGWSSCLSLRSCRWRSARL
jgi:serine/threonine-protein kinase